MSGFSLKILKGSLKDEEFFFEESGLCMIGRDQSCSISIPREKDIGLSRIHCLIVISPDNIRIRDLYSTNGTYVNNKRLMPAAMGNEPEEVTPNDKILVDGDKISISNLVIQVSMAVSNESAKVMESYSSEDNPITTSQTTKTKLISFPNKKTRGDSLIPDTNSVSKDSILRHKALEDTQLCLSLPITEPISRVAFLEKKEKKSIAVDKKDFEIEGDEDRLKTIERKKEEEILDLVKEESLDESVSDEEAVDAVDAANDMGEANAVSDGDVVKEIDIKEGGGTMDYKARISEQEDVIKDAEDVKDNETDQDNDINNQFESDVEDAVILPEAESRNEVDEVELLSDQDSHVQEESLLFNGQAMKSMEELISIIAHDYNNRLAIIKGYAELLKSTDNLDKIKSYADKIDHSAQLSIELTEDLMLFASNEKVQGESVDISEMLTEIVSVIKHTKGRGVTIEYDVSDTNQIYHTQGNQLEIHDALLNIAINAIGSMQGSGAITFSINAVTLSSDDISKFAFQVEAGDFIHISINDTGKGINKEDFSHIFEPFFTTKSKDIASGMGLTVVYGVIKQHNGTMNVTTTPNKGTRFDIYLPYLEKVNNDFIKNPMTKENFEKLNATILIIDDEQNMRSLINEMLSLYDINVKTSNNQSEALKVYQENMDNISLIIVDMDLSKDQEKDLYIEMTKINRDVKIIFTSEYKKSSGIKSVTNDGNVGYLLKPYSKNTLYNSVYSLLVK